MSNLVISISKTKHISSGINITTSPPGNESTNSKNDFNKNDLHISAYKFTEEMLEVLKTKISALRKIQSGIKNIIVIDFVFDEAPNFSIELFNRFSEITKLRIVVVVLSPNAYKCFNSFKEKIKFEALIFNFDFPFNKNIVDLNEVEGLNGIFYKTANVFERKKMKYENEK
ncbi:hypothetical protein CDIK_0491 [Cucumispora dikerogammari]|nr:hypothetical protein CDIK_0491 [Cucumispora dikerogammari]